MIYTLEYSPYTLDNMDVKQFYRKSLQRGLILIMKTVFATDKNYGRSLAYERKESGGR